jgi:predicted flap endonuclease-1-like 5' DNA nuclease
LLKAGGIHSFADLARKQPSEIQPILDRAGANFALADPETWPDQAALAARNRWTSLRYLQDGLFGGRRRKVKRGGARRRPAQRRRSVRRPAVIDIVAARAAGFRLRGADDLTIVEGIGPKIAGLLRRARVNRFAELAKTPRARIRSILEKAGPRYRLADPGTWPRQAALASRNKWSALKRLQAKLYGGRKTRRR